MNLYRTRFFTFLNRFCKVFQQAFLNNTQPGGPSHRKFVAHSFVLLGIASTLVAAGSTQAASLSSTPTSVSYGTVPIGNKLTQTLAIKNVTTSSVTVSSYSISNSAFSISSLAVPF